MPDVAATSFANLNIELQLQVFVNTTTEFTFVYLCILTWFMRVFCHLYGRIALTGTKSFSSLFSGHNEHVQH